MPAMTLPAHASLQEFDEIFEAVKKRSGRRAARRIGEHDRVLAIRRRQLRHKRHAAGRRRLHRERGAISPRRTVRIG